MKLNESYISCWDNLTQCIFYHSCICVLRGERVKKER